jgi:hypothetical protein
VAFNALLEKQTISVDNFDLVEKLFRYLHECCIRVDLAMRIGKVTPILIQKFSWNNIPDLDEAALLTSLKETFSLKELNRDTVNLCKTADEISIIITAPSIRIEIKLDLSRSKAIATLEIDSDHNEGIQSYEYRILKLASGVMVCAIEPPSDSIKNALKSGGLLDAPFYDLVSKMGRE